MLDFPVSSPREVIGRHTMKLIRIGYWQSELDPGWPDVRDFVDVSWDEDEREEVSYYLRSGTLVWYCMGFSTCRICGKRNGTNEFSDGTFMWPEGLAHYVEDHAVRPPERVVAHASAAMRRLESATVDTTWWKSLAR